jgi:hypothetical protein
MRDAVNAGQAIVWQRGWATCARLDSDAYLDAAADCGTDRDRYGNTGSDTDTRHNDRRDAARATATRAPWF